MPTIDETWLRRAFHSLKEMLEVDARQRNEMIQFLIDEGFWQADKFKDFESAVAKWNSCKSPTKGEFFKFGELWALALRFERHHLFLRVMEDLGYDTPRLRPTEERRLALLEKLADSTARHQEDLAEINASLKRLVPPMTHESAPRGRPSFSLPVATSDTAVERIGCP